MKGSILDVRKEEFEKLFNLDLSDSKIGKIMGISKDTIYAWRRKRGYVRNSLTSNKEIPITQNSLEVILGTMLGDGDMSREYANARYSNGHGPRLKDYCLYITDLLSDIGAKMYYSKRRNPDPRTGIYYEKYFCRTPCNPALNYLYEAFYKNKKKVIPFELLDNFTAKSLAFMYMDDGSKTLNGYEIATMCFTEKEILEFRKFLFIKFNLETSMFKDRRIYIKAKSKFLFRQLVLPYMHESMMYKL